MFTPSRMIEEKKLVLERKMEKEFKRIVINKMKKEMKIMEVYIFDENRYIYHVLNKMEEEFYIINEEKICKMKIEKRKINKKKKKFEYACGLGESAFIHFKIFFEEDDEELTYMKIDDKILYNKLDGHLHKMFFDIFRMDNSYNSH